MKILVIGSGAREHAICNNLSKKERLKDLNKNAYKKEELNLLNRLIKYVDNHLLFLKKFFVPFSITKLKQI